MFALPQAYGLFLQQIFFLISPAVLIAGIVSLVTRRIGIDLPLWAIAIGSVFSLPFVHRIRAWSYYRSMQHKAARLGAVLPPQWRTSKIGNTDVLRMLMEAWREGFLSDHLWEKMHELGQTYMVYVLWDPNYVTSDANVVKTILATDFGNYVKGPKFRTPMKSVLGSGVFNSDGDMWKFHRSMTRPFFSRERISHFELFDKYAERAMKRMKERMNSGYAVDFQDLISRFTLDSASEFLFGASVNSLESSLPYPFHAPASLREQPPTQAEEFAKAFAAAQTVISARARLGHIWPWFELAGSKTAPFMRIVNAFLQPILEEALRKAKEEKASGKGVEKKDGVLEDDDTLLDYLVRYTSDPVVLHDEVLNIMIAGRDTTAATLTIVVYFLSQYPDVLRRLREEILIQVGPSRRPTYDDIREMKFLRAVLNETLRLYPSVPWNVRYAVNDGTIPSSDPEKPFFVAAGTPVSYSVHCMHRRKDYWGPDAEEFDPDRFIDERLHKYLTPNPFIFLPFNAGPRICLGQQFAYNEMSFFLIRLLQHFDTIALDVDSQPSSSRPRPEWKGLPGRKGVEKFWPKTHLTLYSEGGMWVKMGEVQNDAE
uniref:Cytochrome P450 n=1 Tax=Phlebia brevispora TaxID=194682 RepID=G5ELB0_9APHY|nr:cytochrome P450 [Phlebia brevispora]